MNSFAWQITALLSAVLALDLLLRRRARPRRIALAAAVGAAALVGLFAFGASGNRTVAALAAGNPSASLSQCANDPAPSPSTDGCSASDSDWVNGNVNGSKANYLEGDSLPYRMLFDNLSIGSHTVTIEWDTTQGGKHALDYLTTFNRTVATANPCLGVTGCNPASFTTYAIPADPQVTGAGVTPVAGNFTMFGGTITAVSAYSGGAGFPAGNNTRAITLTFTAVVANPVLSWAGHISLREDWGASNSAVAISGSPYHTRLIDLDGSGGNQDRALSADAVVFPGSITIVKDATVNGPTTFPFTASPSPLANFVLIDDGTATNTKAFPGLIDFKTYSVAESVPASWTLKGVKCSVSGGLSTTPPSTTTATVSIDLQEGDNVVCTYTNEPKPGPKLHLRKVVVNDNGGTATVADFTLTADGTDDNDLSGTSPVDSGAGLLPDTWTLSEKGVAGYTASDWVCTGDGTQDGSTITLGYEEEATCTITNDDIAPMLHLRKVVVNDNGGTATVADFTLMADGTDDNDLSGTSPVDSDKGLLADTWLLSEKGPAGYGASAWVCDGGTQGKSTITVGIGEEATCTITNDDIAPILRLRKLVTNDNGGTAIAADFTLMADGTDDNDLSGTSPVDSGAGLVADTWTLSEKGVAGYDASAWVCDGGTQDGSSITVGIGGEATCTITNDDVAPMLHLRKVVVNDNGGTATVKDFTLMADGTDDNDLSGTSPVDSGMGLIADTWELSEKGPAGYGASAWVCEGGTQDGSSITVGIGGEATCTITNDDGAPKLQLRKVVVNDNGGTATVADFTLMADGTGGNDLSGTSPVDSGQGLVADTWTLSEKGPAGYDASAWVCTGDGTQEGSTITLAASQSATCTITNDDIAPVLNLRKVVVNDNGGTATLADFTLAADGTDGNDLLGTSPVDSGKGLVADTWTLSETGPAGYSASEWVCVGDEQNPSVRAIVQDGAEITVGIGEKATCTITNDDIAPVLNLRKVVVNDNGGTATVADFTLAADGGEGNDLSGTSPVDSGAGLIADTWTLSETGPAGYAASTWVCVGGTQDGSSITVGIGGEATCTITNDDIAPILRLRKIVVNDNGGTATVADFTLTADGTAGNDLSGTSPVDSGAGLVADTWTLSEVGPAGYTASAWTCVGGTQLGSTIAVGIGADVTCTITNDDNPVILPPTPIVAPPATVRGIARIAGPEGCILGGSVTTRVTARNVARVVFTRDGVVVKRVKGAGKGLQAFTLRTVLTPDMVGVHTVKARVTFVSGASPRLKVLTHRFALCRSLPVTG